MDKERIDDRSSETSNKVEHYFILSKGLISFMQLTHGCCMFNFSFYSFLPLFQTNSSALLPHFLPPWKKVSCFQINKNSRDTNEDRKWEKILKIESTRTRWLGHERIEIFRDVKREKDWLDDTDIQPAVKINVDLLVKTNRFRRTLSKSFLFTRQPE